jgi:hypothetical protein
VSLDKPAAAAPRNAAKAAAGAGGAGAATPRRAAKKAIALAATEATEAAEAAAEAAAAAAEAADASCAGGVEEWLDSDDGGTFDVVREAMRPCFVLQWLFRVFALCVLIPDLIVFASTSSAAALLSARLLFLFFCLQSGFGARKRGGGGFAMAPPKQKARLAPRRDDGSDGAQPHAGGAAEVGVGTSDDGHNLYCESQVVTYNQS